MSNSRVRPAGRLHRRLQPSAVILAAVVFALTTASAVAPAQTSDSSSTLPLEVIRYLERDLFIAPGIGFKRVKIGDSFDEVLNSWGKPQAQKTALLSRKKQWYYSVNDTTVIMVEGKTTVEAITVSGGMTTPFETTEGARYGMAPYQIVTIYGAGPEGDLPGKLDYPRRGIAFDFQSGAVRTITVSAPRKD